MRDRYSSIFISALITCMLLTGCGSLINSAARGDLNSVKKYLTKGEDINQYDRHGWTPLIWAIYYNNYDVVKYLLDNKANPNAKTLYNSGSIYKESTPLIIASYYGYEDIVILLLKFGVNADDVNGIGESAYAIAKKYNQITIMYLLGKGADRQTLAALENLKKKEAAKQEYFYKYMVLLNNGSTISCNIVSQSRDAITIETKNGKLTMDKENIIEIQPKGE
jgi:ankyrin repeat protein